MSSIGIIVPTLLTRNALLIESLASIRQAGDAYILIVAPNSEFVRSNIPSIFFDDVIEDLGFGLAAAIDHGIKSLPDFVEYINWLGDDDLLTKNSLRVSFREISSRQDIALVYGICNYINSEGNFIWKNRSGKFASLLLHFGPQLIPQPGALMRREAYMAIGGLNYEYKWAFDLDLIIRLKQVGRLSYINETLSMFRWHEGSLSVGGRRGSVKEASMIRRTFLPKSLRWLSPIWEVPLKSVILFAGYRLNRKIKYLRG